MSIRKAIAGFSLIELIIFIVVVSVALVGVLSVMNLTTAHSADPLIHKQAIAIAESMLEEIELQNFASGGYTPSTPATQAQRQYLDDVSDYDGFTENGIYAINGTTPISGLEKYSLAVSVTTTTLGPSGSFTNSQIGTTGAKLITVTVTDPEGGTITLSGYRTNY